MSEAHSPLPGDRVAIATWLTGKSPYSGRGSGSLRWAVPGFVAVALLAVFSPAYSQSSARGGVAGRILDATTSAPVSLATVEIVEAARTVETDSLGRFRLVDLEPNLVTIRVRRVGYAPVERSLLLRPGRVMQMDYLLSPQAVVLPEVEVKEKAVETNAMLSGFEERRKMGLGTFWDETEIRRMEHRQLPDLLYQARGVKITRDGSEKYVANSRRRVTGLDLKGMSTPCYMQIVIDGTVVYSPDDSRRANFPPDLTRLVPLSEISAIEVYSSAAGVPMEFRRLGSHCGVLALWTRRGGRVPQTSVP